jgi:hypothetical protein
MKLHAYDAIHRRLSRERGRAADHPCTRCGAQAAEWALQGDSELVDGGLRYSENPGDYAPMCRSCHRILDQSFDVRNLGAVGAAAIVQKLKDDPIFHAIWVEKTRIGGKNTPMSNGRWTCSCGLESNLLGVQRHQRSKGCTGMESS